MKLKKFKQIVEREGFDDIDYPFYDNDDEEYKDDDGEDDDSDDDMSHLCYLLRSMFNNIIDVNVESSGLDVSITAQFGRRESISDVVKVFEIIKKIKKDILAQYSSYYEMWETKSGLPMITFEFTLDDDDDKDGIVTNDKDDDDFPW